MNQPITRRCCECKTILNETIKVKGKNLCKLCESIRKKEYREKNWNAVRELERKYYLKNREKYLSHIDCECGMQYQHKHRARHFRTKFHIENVK